MLITNINKKQLALSAAIPLLIGGLASLVNFSGFREFETVNKPALAPPMIIFPIVWTVLYLLMGFSAYLICKADVKNKVPAYIIYALQLAVNFLWTCLFFGKKDYIGAFATVIVMLLLVCAMIYVFFRVNRKSAYLQLPYLVWTAFASYLNYMVYILNK